MGPITSYNVTRPACGLKGSTHLSPVHAYKFLSRIPPSRQLMVELFVLTHAFRYGNQKKNALLVRLELANADFVGV